ncbi:MAG: glycosyltransferase family 4 protein [Candidatus Krumholzibacteriota bacterium]|nr:glycosyltransferase family 4 protein [Candidatus Krumholzibacteriota bacterium]
MTDKDKERFGLRILMVQTFHYYRGGDSTCMFNLTRLLEEKGHQVVHFAMRHPRNLPAEHSDYFSSEIDFPRLLEDFSPLSALRVVAKSVYNREARRKISRLADAAAPDIAHFHNIHGHLTTSIIEPLRRRGIPVVWTLHDYRLVCPNSTFLCGREICERCLPRKYYHALLHRCKKGSAAASLMAMMTSYYDRITRVPSRVSRFITPSDFLRRKLIEGKISRDKISWIPNFVDVESFRAGEEEDYFLFFGRLSFEKGIDTLIRAVAGVAGAKLKIVGEGPGSDDLKGLAAELKAPVEFMGYKSGKELRALLEEARFIVVPSIWYENLPFSVMEAMAAGKPVVAADIGGIPEMVEDGVNGFLFPAGDTGLLREKLELIWNDRDLRAGMGEKGREKALSLYDRQVHYDKIMRVYQEVLGREGIG